MIKTCDWCKKEFDTARQKQRFCCSDCNRQWQKKNRYRILENRKGITLKRSTCQICSKRFFQKNIRGKCCSIACKKEYKKRYSEQYNKQYNALISQERKINNAKKIKKKNEINNQVFRDYNCELYDACLKYHALRDTNFNCKPCQKILVMSINENQS